jgi:hypothetical protein
MAAVAAHSDHCCHNRHQHPITITTNTNQQSAITITTMTQPTIDLLACLGICSLIALPLLLLLAWVERPRYKPSKGRSVRLNPPIR